MKIQPECHDCLRRLVELTVAQASADPVLQEQARRASLEIMARECGPEAIPAGIANQFHQAIMTITGNSDPFAIRKAAETAYLGRRFREVAAAYGADLESLLKLAAVGNAIDFFRDEAEVTRELASRVEFGLSELEHFQPPTGGSAGPPALPGGQRRGAVL